MSWTTVVPAELLQEPKPLCVLVGLQPETNAFHKSVWEEFSKRRNAPFNYILRPLDHRYPLPKGRKTTQELYKIKGVLKRTWLTKHLQEVPCVAVLCADLEYTTPQWENRVEELASRVRALASQLGRNVDTSFVNERPTRVAVLLLQQTSYNIADPAETAELADSLCRAVGLDKRSLCELPQDTDRLSQLCQALERQTLAPLANEYFSALLDRKKVQQKSSQLGSTALQLLLAAKASLKLGFLWQMRSAVYKDGSVQALGYYREAYDTLVLKVGFHVNRHLEVKLIAGFLAFLRCRLLFADGHAQEAVKTFKQHMELLREKTGLPELAFEDEAWLSGQYQLFGSLLERVCEGGSVTPSAFEHPGFYYQTAASYTHRRQQEASRSCRPLDVTPSPDPLATLERTDYFGQRPWRQFQPLNVEPFHDPQLEATAIRCLQAKEINFKYAEHMVWLLTSAGRWFQRHATSRLQLRLNRLLATQLLALGDHTKAAASLSQYAGLLKRDGWWRAFTDVTRELASVTRGGGDAATLFSSLLELASSYSCEEDRQGAYERLDQLSRGEEAAGDSGRDWAEAARAAVPIDMSTLAGAVEVKVVCELPPTLPGEAVKFTLFLHNSSVGPLTLSQLEVAAAATVCQLNDGSLTGHHGCEVAGEDVLLPPQSVCCLHFALVPPQGAETLTFTEVRAKLSLFSLHWTSLLSPGFSRPADLPPLNSKRHSASPRVAFSRQPLVITCSQQGSHDDSTWSSIRPQPSVRLSGSRRACEIKCGPAQALAGETFTLMVTLRCNDGLAASDLTLVASGLDSITGTGRLPDIPAGESLSVPLQCTPRSSCELRLRLTGPHISCERVVAVEVAKPFRTNYTLLSTNCRRLEEVLAGREFIFRVSVTNVSNSSLVLNDTRLQSTPNVKLNRSIRPEPLLLAPGETSSECHLLTVRSPRPSAAAVAVALGSLTLFWSREDGDELAVCEQRLPEVAVRHVPILLWLDTPPHLVRDSPASFRLYLENIASEMRKVTLNLEPDEHFLVEGIRQQVLDLAIGERRSITFQLRPKVGGRWLPLPPLRVQGGPSDGDLASMLPTRVFVLDSEEAAQLLR